MTAAWDAGDPPPHARITVAGWLRVLIRAVLLIVLVFGGLVILLLARLVERPLCGLDRPVTPFITQTVCRGAFIILRMQLRVQGTPMVQRGAVVANHSSWLDIFSLNAAKRIYFVSKAEVAKWPGIGWLARATGTMFIFKTTLFQSFFADGLRDEIYVQPVSVSYAAPADRDRFFYGWWGDMDFGTHLLATLAPARNGRVTVSYHPPLRVADFANRKALAKAAENAVRSGHQPPVQLS